MTQYTFPTINPATETGNQLATDLNGLWPAVISTHRGAARPAYAVAGTVWAKTVSSTVEQVYYFDGVSDVLIGTINPTTHAWTPAGVPNSIPVGLGPLPWFNVTPPSLWIMGYGQVISRTTYSGLFAIYGTTFGAGDGSTTFNMPDVRGRIAAFKDDMGGSAAGRLTNTVMSPDGNTVGAVGGSQTHTIVDAELSSHTHTTGTALTIQSGTGANVIDNAGTGNPTGVTGSDQPHNNTQPTIIANGIFYAGV